MRERIHGGIRYHTGISIGQSVQFLIAGNGWKAASTLTLWGSKQFDGVYPTGEKHRNAVLTSHVLRQIIGWHGCSNVSLCEDNVLARLAFPFAYCMCQRTRFSNDLTNRGDCQSSR